VEKSKSTLVRSEVRLPHDIGWLETLAIEFCDLVYAEKKAASRRTPN